VLGSEWRVTAAVGRTEVPMHGRFAFGEAFVYSVKLCPRHLGMAERPGDASLDGVANGVRRTLTKSWAWSPAR
jgi:hypothetical protein